MGFKDISRINSQSGICRGLPPEMPRPAGGREALGRYVNGVETDRGIFFERIER